MRRKISLFTLILIGVGLGILIKNIKIGLVIGLVMGFLISGLSVGGRKK